MPPPLALPQRVWFVGDAARLVGADHARGRVHGDLRPEYLVAGPDGVCSMIAEAQALLFRVQKGDKARALAALR